MVKYVGRGRFELDDADAHVERIYIGEGDYEELAPGAMYWQPINNSAMCPHEPQCERHLVVVCPDGTRWDIDSRSDGCPSMNVAKHRCWIRSGEPPQITVGKQGGPTCRVGGGSIRTRGGHYWLIAGEFIEAHSGEAHPTEGDAPIENCV